MAELLKEGAEFLAEVRDDHNSRQVTYSRGVFSVVVQAALGRKLLRLGDEFGTVRMEWTGRDYIIRAVDLVLNSVVTLPLKGDLISDSVDGETYKVLAPGDEPVWQPHDNHGVSLRVHTKLVT